MREFLFYFVTFVVVYWATVSTMDAVVDQHCCCLVSGQFSLRHRLRTFLVVLASLSVLLVLGAWHIR